MAGLGLTWNTMAEQNVPAQPPTRTDEQIVPTRTQCGQSGVIPTSSKLSTCHQTNVPAIDLQTVLENKVDYNEKTGVYSIKVDEKGGSDLSSDLLIKALRLPPVNTNSPIEYLHLETT
ncbi:hypothetical protein Tco_0214102 [Tanacetum coccineum]